MLIILILYKKMVQLNKKYILERIKDINISDIKNVEDIINIIEICLQDYEDDKR